MCFRTCSNCGTAWRDRGEFLADPFVRLNGYQANFAELEAGLFLFTHMAPECGTTLSLPAQAFLDLHDGPVFERSFRGTADCPGLCGGSSLDPCPKFCACAFVRDVLQKVLKWPKKGSGTREFPAEKRP